MENEEKKVSNQVVKATIKNDRCTVNFKENDGGDISAMSKDCAKIIHPDLVLAFNMLKTHLVVLCEQPESGMVNHANIGGDFDITLLDNYVITGIVIGGTDEHEGVTIIGQKLLKSGKVLNLIAPFTKYEDDYIFSSELSTDVSLCTYEVEQYVFHNKCGIKQQEFDFDAPEESSVTLSNAAEGIVRMTVSSKGKKKSKKSVETMHVSSDNLEDNPLSPELEEAI